MNVINQQMDRVNPGTAVDITLHGNNREKSDTYNETETSLS